jgi:hypothetical protein
MTTATAEGPLLEGPDQKEAPKAPKLVRVAREHGLGPLKQFRQILSLQMKRAGLHTSEYYDFELYASRYSAEERAQFLGTKGSRKLNQRLTPKAAQLHFDLMNDKPMFAALLSGFGLRATETQAVVSATRAFGNVPVLRDIEAITRYFTQEARYPVFAKPVLGSLSVGSVLIEGVDADGSTLHLGNGKTVAIQDFARAVLENQGRWGFLLQSAVRQHPKLTEVAGPALGTIRVLTVPEEEARPRTLYVLWKIPSPQAMSDNFWQDGSMIANVDLETGEVLGCRQGTGPDTVQIESHPVTGQPIVGLRLPFWSEVKALAEAAHAIFPKAGVIGWDIGISEDGPVIVEGNNAPFHTLYQLATGEGVMNPRFAPVFEKISARQAAQAKTKKAGRKSKKEAGRAKT